MEIVAYLLCALLYGALSVYFWRTRWAAVEPHASSSPLTPAIEHALLLAPLTLHSVLLAHTLFAGDGLHLGLGNAVSAILWLTVLIYWSGNFIYRLEGLQALVLPLAAVAVLLQGLIPSAPALPNTESVAFKFHLLIAMLAYSLL
ncbi:MAG: cytochrome C biogenesis protein, partial [Pseudomonadota bacterium]